MPAWRDGLLLRGHSADRGGLRLAAGASRRRAGARPHGPAPGDRRHRGAPHRARADPLRASAGDGAQGVRQAASSWRSRWSHCRSGSRTSTSGTSPPSTTGRSRTSGSTRSSTRASSASACSMWMPIAGPLPVPSWFGGGAQVGYVVVARLASAGLGNILMWSGAALYVAYAPGEAYWNISATADQGTAGVIMMVEGGLVTLAMLAWALLRLGFARRGEAATPRACRRARRAADPGARRARGGRGSRRPARRADHQRSRRLVERQPPPLPDGLHRRDLDPGRRDRRRAAPGAVLRRVDDRLGEHDRRRPRRAFGRLLVRRQAGRSLPRPGAGSRRS